VARANGKVILLGEHAVVYGVPAIAAGIALGARARAAVSKIAEVRIGESIYRAGDGSALGRAIEALQQTLGLGPHRVEVELDLPPGAGLGASAAIGVAAARAVLEAQGLPDTRERVLEAAAQWEGVFHGNASGIDAAAASHPGCLLFTRERGAEPLPVAKQLELAVGLAGPPASTRVMVEAVAKLGETRPELLDKTLAAVRSLVNNAKLCITAGDLPGLGRLMDLNQMLLSGLFVSTEGIETACALARESGALGAKLTGAGGGGAVIALCDGDAEPILASWRDAGISCFATSVTAASGA
jgi:mevalonate kinase